MYDFLNIIIPVYNEGSNILHTINEITNKVSAEHQIFIIYDNDEDNTLPVIKEILAERTNIKPVKNRFPGKGVLNAIKTGFETVDDGILLVSMADLSDDYTKVDAMLEKINEGYDIVCGSRYMAGGRQNGGPFLKGLFSRTAGLTLHVLTGIPTHDISNSFKMYTKKVLNNIDIESNGGFEIGMEILVKAFLKGYKITEVPCVWTDRSDGESRFKLWKWIPKYLYWYWFAVKGNIKKLLGNKSM